MTTGQAQSTSAVGQSGFRLYLVFDNATGEIRQWGRAAWATYEDGGQSMRDQAGPGQTALAIAAFPDPKTMKVVAGVVVLR